VEHWNWPAKKVEEVLMMMMMMMMETFLMTM